MVPGKQYPVSGYISWLSTTKTMIWPKNWVLTEYVAQNYYHLLFLPLGVVLNDLRHGISGLSLMLYNQYIIILYKHNESTTDIKCWLQALQLTHGIFKVVLNGLRQAVSGLKLIYISLLSTSKAIIWQKNWVLREYVD